MEDRFMAEAFRRFESGKQIGKAVMRSEKQPADSAKKADAL